jgi:hypothetical protein
VPSRNVLGMTPQPRLRSESQPDDSCAILVQRHGIRGRLDVQRITGHSRGQSRLKGGAGRRRNVYLSKVPDLDVRFAR